jgi:hypothetical protein
MLFIYIFIYCGSICLVCENLRQYLADATQSHLSRKKSRISVCFSITYVHLHNTQCSVVGKQTKGNYRNNKAKPYMLQAYNRNDLLSQQRPPSIEWRSWETPLSIYWLLLVTNSCVALQRTAQNKLHLAFRLHTSKMRVSLTTRVDRPEKTSSHAKCHCTFVTLA